MKEIHIARTLVTKRREMGITQDELANCMGVSKASVSKWETEQSYPDITLLPRLASYFNVTIDELMGYAAQMERADIRLLYLRLAKDFAVNPFETVLLECRGFVKKYYSCFPLLLKIAALYLNHHMLAASREAQIALITEAATLCHRVRDESEDALLGREAVALEATCRLMQGDAQAVLDLLGEEVEQFTSDSALIGQAYQMLGNQPRAKRTAQISLYQHLLLLVGESATCLTLCADEPERSAEIIKRTQAIADAYHIEELHSNTMAQFYLAAAYAGCRQCKPEAALESLTHYAAVCRHFQYTLHGDDYFDALQPWFEHFDLGVEAPRNEKLIRESMVAAVAQNPAFATLSDNPHFRSLVETLKSNLGV